MKPLPRIEGEVQRYQIGPDGDEWVKADDYAALNDYAALVQMERDMARAEVAENDGVIRVWRRRTETAEAEVERLRAKIDWRNREPPHCPTCGCPGERSAALNELAQMDQDMGLSGPTTPALPEG